MADPLIRDLLVRGSAWCSFLLYMLALNSWLLRKPLAATRSYWTCAYLLFVLHVVLAFHLVHHWSHVEAWEATRLQGGFGHGIYLNYFVLFVWLADVLWWWLLPRYYEYRRKSISYLIHGILLFMWFNAAVIFAKDRLWIVSSIVFAGLFFEMLKHYVRTRSH